MNVDDMIILSIDDHVVEPPDLFEGHLPPAYRDRAPRLVRDEHGKERWQFEGKEFGNSASTPPCPGPRRNGGSTPAPLAEMRPAAYLVDQRIADMNRNGVLASMCFPSLPWIQRTPLPP